MRLSMSDYSCHDKTKDHVVLLYDGFSSYLPDLSSLKVFGLWVCVKKSSNRCGKLDWNDFTGIFLGYIATDQNIIYLDLETGIVKWSRHTQFDKAWYLQAT